ncbi:PREDICTED: putative methyltransferase NSUN7 [Ficedula albicollis]|uniref:NOP2/Sun RNA methyltransferase family member 7 n=1 Tax=Ficedula albicollis TaxID=59894 RepID=U3JJM9_FICAL|nr:PREDICTED: putative methyltransferase NSUN7 [Ficedula albicollis]XP_016153535.1 PREDICTED: putative methyltransferase NSUN7 [Ficedula albicollis]
MPDSENNLVSSHVDVINGTSVLSEMKISDEKRSVEKRTVAQIEKNGYPDSIYINAAKIFQGIHTEKSEDKMQVRYGDNSESPMMAFKDEHSKRVSYELAFNTLKYQDLLEEILLDSHTYPCYSIPDELTSLLVVMLYDLQDRKFKKRKIFAEEELVAEVQEIGNYLYSYRTKLAAALARCRIKYDALSIEYFVPETVCKQEQRASTLPLWFWVNTLKISLEDVIRDLEMKGFTKVESVSDFDHYTYAVDQHCHDVLVFPSSLKEELLNLDLFADCKLLLQDKSRSLAVHAAQALLSEGGDIIVAHIGSHLTIARMSVLTNQSRAKIFACGVKSLAKEEELSNSFSHMGCENIQLLHEDFTELEPTDSRLDKAKVILLLPQCSGLGAGNPMEFILSEHRDPGLLRDLFQGFVSEDKLGVLAERHLNELIHALKFKKVQAIVYCTCSVYPEENELVVQKALESEVEGDKVRRYRLIPSVFSTCTNSESSTEMFFKIEPSEISSGCFLAVLQKEKDTSKKVPAKDILDSAAVENLLDDITEEKPKEEVKKQKVKRKRKVAASKPKAAKLLPRQTAANVKTEVPVSKSASKIPEQHEYHTKIPSDIQEKRASRKKAAGNSPQKTAHRKKTANNTPQKTVSQKKPASHSPQKKVHRTKAASNT